MRLVWPAAEDPSAERELDDEALEGLYATASSRHVRSDFVSSIDSAIEIDGRSEGLGGGDDHQVFATLRAVCDVVLVGSGTAVTEKLRAGQAQPPPVWPVGCRGGRVLLPRLRS